MTDKTTPRTLARRILDNQEAQFWIIQLIGWTGWMVAGLISWTYWKVDSAYYFMYPVGALIGIILTTGLRYCYRMIWQRSLTVRAIIAIIASFLVAAAWQVAKNFGTYSVFPEMMETNGLLQYFKGLLASFYIILCWSGLYFGIKYYKRSQEQTQQILKVSAEAHQAQLKMLRYQLNPHFLFNTLNAISTLILERQTDLANTMITRLASFLRHSLDSDPMEKVLLEDEISALNLYLDIEQVRFEERLRIDIDLDEASRRALIPSLLLQPLVENAIKYAIATSEDGGTIKIQARVFAGELLLELSDDGPGMSDEAQQQLLTGKGVGLHNTRDRLRSAYHGNQTFRIASVEPHGLIIFMQMPYETR